MNEQRRGEIALLILKRNFRRDGIQLGERSRQEISLVADELALPEEEVLEFSKILAQELFDETFPEQRSIKTDFSPNYVQKAKFREGGIGRTK